MKGRGSDPLRDLAAIPAIISAIISADDRLRDLAEVVALGVVTLALAHLSRDTAEIIAEMTRRDNRRDRTSEPLRVMSPPTRAMIRRRATAALMPSVSGMPLSRAYMI